MPKKSDTTPIVDADGEVLYGSDTLADTFEIDGATVSASEIVKSAYVDSGLTEQAWNDLPDADRDAKLQAELDKRGYVAPSADPLAGATVIAASAPVSGDARVESDAVSVAGATVTVDDPKQPLGSLPDTATTTATLDAPINTNLSDAPTLTDAIVPTKPGGADLEDIEEAPNADLISEAPPRAHDSLVNQLDLKWSELKHFVSMVEGDIDGELGEVLALVRSKL